MIEPNMLQQALTNSILRDAAGKLAPGRCVHLCGVWGSSGALAAAAMGRMTQWPVVVVTPHMDAADAVADDIEVFTGEAAQTLPAWEVGLGRSGPVAAAVGPGDELTGERLRICNLLSQRPDQRDESVEYLVAPVLALLQPVPSAAALAAARLELRKDAALDLEELSAWLVEAGYDHVEQVDQQGEFARRGGIVDIFPPGVSQAVRVEFFGDVIESIRRFDLDTLRSTDEIASYDLTAAVVMRANDAASITHLLDYLPDETILCMSDPQEIADTAREVYDRVRNDLADAGSPEALYRPEELLGAAERLARLELHAFRPREADALDLGVRSLQRLSVNTPEALAELQQLSAEAQPHVYCENPAEQTRFEQLLAADWPMLAGRAVTRLGHLQSGFHWPRQKLIAVGHHEIFHRYTQRRRVRRVRTGRPLGSLMDLQAGEYVVHVAHGIAKFDGLQRIEREGRSEEYLRLKFADNAVLHVPASRIHLVQKYVGSRQKRPNLSKLGGGAWSRAKQRVGEAVKDLAAEMLRVQALRAASPGVAFPLKTDWQRQFAEEFIYTETEDQLRSMDDIHRDMFRPRPMDRLLCGDVGFGKTELAMRAAFKVVEAGRQVAVLVPTTVLADQHFRTFTERMADYPVAVDVLSRFRKRKEQVEICRQAAAKQIDVLIGTHRLLSPDVKFADLGLVIIDEEQRFGVEHKEQLKAARAEVDVLTMTATPIPRTLHMALLGLRDISSLTTAPLDRRAIHTEICQWDDRLIQMAIARELNRNGQVFFVHNRVMDIAPLADRIGGLVPDARVTVAHGQMTGPQLEDAMLKFVRGEIDVLVCTTIIESGLDIPRANTMIIHEADRLGLSELHQLRGRVGRYKHRAYCYLLLPERRSVSPIAGKRLKAVEEFSDLGAGFQIAMRDLEIRGAGNILGPQQSGHIAMVGYELYCQLLEQAVRQLQGDRPSEVRDVHVELGIDAYIPRSYVPSERQRMEIYRRLARCAAPVELEQLIADLDDAYGAVPSVVQTLADAVEIRVRAGQMGIDSIVRHDPDIIFTVSDMSAASAALQGASGSVRVVDAGTLYWRPPEAFFEMPTLVRVLLKRLKNAPA